MPNLILTARLIKLAAKPSLASPKGETNMLIMRHAQSEFNVHFNATGRDPGIRDPDLTPYGRAQAAQTAAALAAYDITRLVVSPYRRAVQTAEIIAAKLGLDVMIESEIGEHCMYHCDMGSDPEELAALWPHRDFAHLQPNWWLRQRPIFTETRQQVRQRCEKFQAKAAGWPDRHQVMLVSHWGFIITLTGLDLGNASVLRLETEALSALEERGREKGGLEVGGLEVGSGLVPATIVYQPSL
ncbi:MAG: histidine phosphatase family protein [Candidatus Symbiobacter sp.]|nr:histidine phosphatase family protein [Candidatus Symbiobacter sp.]